MMPEEKVGAALLVVVLVFILVLFIGAYYRHEVAMIVGGLGSTAALIFHHAWDRLIAAPKPK